MKEFKAEKNKNIPEKTESYNIAINKLNFKFVEEEVEIVQDSKGNVDLDSLIK